MRTLALFLALVATASASNGVQLKQARQALAEGIPQVAIHKLQAVLVAGDLEEEERAEAVRTLGEAFRADGRHGEALVAIQSLVNARDPAALLLRAEILASAERWQEALPIFHALAEADISARLGEAESLHALGRAVEAIAALEVVVNSHPELTAARLRLADLYIESAQAKKARALLATARLGGGSDSQWRELIEGRLLLLEGNPAAAHNAFDQVLKRAERISEPMIVAATFGITDAGIITEGYDAADRSIENFIWQHPDSGYLPQMFRRLDDMYSHEEDPRENELQRWAQKPQTQRAALARYYLARLQRQEKKTEKEKATLDTFIQTYPGHPLLPKAYERLADWHLLKSDFAGAISALEAAERVAGSDAMRAEIELRSGLVHYRAGEFLLAANLFDSVAKRAPELREIALFNAALAALNQKNFDGFLERYRELTAQFPASPLRSEIILEQGLLQARTSDARGRETLLRFVEHFPAHPRIGEARIALAELALAAGDMQDAAHFQLAVGEASTAPELTDQSQVLAIFLAEAQTPRRDGDVATLAQKFLRERPGSPLVPEVRMKLGQVYFRAADFANAETQFTILATENPDGPYAETALFLAGESAMKSINTGSVDRALELFDRVAKRDGPMKLYARQQQAIVQSRLGKEVEAVALYDIILAAQPPPDAELRFAALRGKGDNFLAIGSKQPKQLEAAVAVFDQLARLDGVTPAWRNEALYKKGKALEQLARIPAALTAYYDVLATTAADGREFLWYYKAGFDAARIFEAQEQWKPAIGIYEKMAVLEGPRASEAREQTKRLRLAHFIWD